MPEIVISGCAELPDMANVNRVTTDHSGSLESMAETSSTVSSTAESEHPVHKLSLLNILEMTELFPNSSDLESEQEDIMAETMSSISNHQQQQQDRTDKAHKVESAIKARKDHHKESFPSPQRARFTSSPSHNPGRFCRKPKERSSSEGGTTGLQSHHVNGHLQSTRIESPCQVSVTSLNANIRLPMDKLSTKLFIPVAERSHTSLGVTTSPRRFINGNSCFGGRGRAARQYTIHPDWVSENLSIGKARLTDRSGGSDFLDYVKRSQSCPPPMRNVITWDNKYNPASSSRQVNGTGLR